MNNFENLILKKMKHEIFQKKTKFLKLWIVIKIVHRNVREMKGWVTRRGHEGVRF